MFNLSAHGLLVSVDAPGILNFLSSAMRKSHGALNKHHTQCYVFIGITWFVLYFYKPLLFSLALLLVIFHKKGKEDRMSPFSVLLCGSEGGYTMKLMNGTDQTKGLSPSLVL